MTSSQTGIYWRKSSRAQDNGRVLRFETLETRALLSASPVYNSIPSQIEPTTVLAAPSRLESSSIVSVSSANDVSPDDSPNSPVDIVRRLLEEGDYNVDMKQPSEIIGPTPDPSGSSQGLDAIKKLIEEEEEGEEEEKKEEAEEQEEEEASTSSGGYDALKKLEEKEKEDAAKGERSDAYKRLEDEAKKTVEEVEQQEDEATKVVYAEGNYAVIFAGGSLDKSARDNYTVYYEAVVDLYTRLTQVYALNPQNIYILYADGDTTGESYNRVESTGATAVSDMTFATKLGSKVLSANYYNLMETFDSLSTVMTHSSHLLFFTYDHGAGVEGNIVDENDYLVGWGEKITSAEVRDAVYQVKAGYVTLAFAQCFSGGILDDFFDPASGAQIISYTDSLGIRRFYSGTALFAGGASTNHYESSQVGITQFNSTEGYAQSFINGLLYTNQTDKLFSYAETYDLFASSENYANNEGIYQTSIEHPWHCGSNFEVFSSSSSFKADVYEPNDFVSSATYLGELDLKETRRITNLYAEPCGGEDWYVFTVPDYVEQSDRLGVWIDSDQKIKTELYAYSDSKDLTLIGSLTSAKSVELNPGKYGYCYVLRISRTDSALSSIAYKLEISLSIKTVVANPPTIKDALEERDALAINWSPVPPSRQYVVSYRKVGTRDWTSVKTSETSFKLTDVCGTYEFRVRANSALSHFHGTVYSEIVQLSTGLQSVDAVSLSAQPSVGTEVTAVLTPKDATVTYQWYRVPFTGNEEAIEGATSATYTVTQDDLGYYLRVRAVGYGDYSGTVETTSTGVVKYSLDSLTIVPCDYIVGTELKTILNPTSATVAYQWYYSDSPEPDAIWTAIPDETASSYVPTVEYIGKYIAVKAFGRGEYGGILFDETPIAVQARELNSIVIDSEPFGVGNTVTTTLSPRDATVEYQWFYSDFPSGASPAPIEGANSSTFVPTQDLIGKYLSVYAMGVGEYRGTVVSATSVTTVQPKPMASIKLSADAYMVGTTITATVSPQAAPVEYQWYYKKDSSEKEDSSLEEWIAIKGATKSSYTPTSKLIGCYVGVCATGLGEYKGSSLLASTPEKIQARELNKITIDNDEIIVGRAVTTSIDPIVATVAYQWYYKDDFYSTTEKWTMIVGASSSVYFPSSLMTGKYLMVEAIGYGDFDGQYVSTTSNKPVETRELYSVNFTTDTFRVGQTVGTELSPSYATATYQWSYRPVATYIGYWTPIEGATSSTYTPTADLVGMYLAVTVSGTGEYTGSSTYTIANAKVSSNEINSLKIDSPELFVGKEVTTTLTPSDISVEYQWFRSDINSESGLKPIEGANQSSYIPTEEDRGKYLAVHAIGTEACYGEIVVISQNVVRGDESTNTVAPSFNVETESLLNGQGVRLSVAASAPIANWTIDWGDGQTTTSAEICDCIFTGHFYAPASEKSYAIRLTAQDLETGETIDSEIAYHRVRATASNKTREVSNAAARVDEENAGLEMYGPMPISRTKDEANGVNSLDAIALVAVQRQRSQSAWAFNALDSEDAFDDRALDALAETIVAR